MGFIRPINYADWISNLVAIAKLDGNIHCCADFTNFNKACPKDELPIPNIDMIVDQTTFYEMVSLIDGFSRYNQICIAPKDQPKKTFACPP